VRIAYNAREAHRKKERKRWHSYRKGLHAIRLCAFRPEIKRFTALHHNAWGQGVARGVDHRIILVIHNSSQLHTWPRCCYIMAYLGGVNNVCLIVNKKTWWAQQKATNSQITDIQSIGTSTEDKVTL
jgi:hypothetical protein